ncbi:MAG: DUF523 domain-containing protein [Magnetococcales bacterium]|nr:DUF523 domain-containing protein [Magnetococcales bacterium]
MSDCPPAPIRNPAYASPVRVAISACLLGAQVRYDGGHKHNPLLSGLWARDVLYFPFCPESECGLGIPREPMHLVGTAEQPRICTRYSSIDHSHRLRLWCRHRLRTHQAAGVAGYLLKSRSPSCGMTQVTVWSEQEQQHHPALGILPGLLRAHHPHLPLAEGDLFTQAESLRHFVKIAREGNTPGVALTGSL